MKVSKTTIYFVVKSRDIQMSWGSAFRQTTHSFSVSPHLFCVSLLLGCDFLSPSAKVATTTPLFSDMVSSVFCFELTAKTHPPTDLLFCIFICCNRKFIISLLPWGKFRHGPRHPSSLCRPSSLCQPNSLRQPSFRHSHCPHRCNLLC